MSIKSKVLAAAATLIVVGGVSTVGTLSASAATPGCSQNGNICVQIFNKRFGTPTNPRFVESVFLGLPFAGVPAILQRISSSNPAGDIIIPAAGTVSDFYAKGMVSAAANSHYGPEHAVQVEYAPHGKPTGLCSAIATATPYQNEGLTLQPCTTPGTTVFVIDSKDAPTASPYFPIVLASTTDFAHPFAMSFPGKSDPAHRLFPQIKVQHLTGNPANVPNDQLWGSVTLPKS